MIIVWRVYFKGTPHLLPSDNPDNAGTLTMVQECIEESRRRGTQATWVGGGWVGASQCVGASTGQVGVELNLNG